MTRPSGTLFGFPLVYVDGLPERAWEVPMKLYCMCENGGNRFVANEPDGPVLERGVVLKRQMMVEKVGVEQYLAPPDELGHAVARFQHYPNVDVRVCMACENRVVIE